MSSISSYSLKKINRSLTSADLLHLLRRSLFGVGSKELKFFSGKSIDACVDVLLTQSSPPPTLIQEDSDVTDPLVPKGKIWTSAPYENDLIDNRRGLMLKMWIVGNLLNRDHSLTEKMTLFWHNHFVTEMDMVKDSRYSYRYAAMLRNLSLGNIKKLIREGTTNVAMLVYLNGNTNTKDAPNENYARELLELFTLGKGTDSKYTEADVRAAARVLSGWKDDKESIAVSFHPELHDENDKQFSSFFDNYIIKGKKGAEGAKETDELIEMIFGQQETARFICRNLYRWFLTSGIDAQVEQNIIQPLAKLLVESNFEIKPVLRALLSSEHFFDPAFRGCMVKSPVDYLVGAMQQFDVVTTCNLYSDHLPHLHFYFYLADMSMDVANPPSVSGWPAYYQPPKFYQWWINSASLGFRTKLLKNLTTPEGVSFNSSYIKIDFVHFVSGFSKPHDATALVEDSTNLLVSIPLTVSVKDKLKAILLSDQMSERYWTESWEKYLANKDDAAARSVVENRLRLLFKAIMDLPEFQMT